MKTLKDIFDETFKPIYNMTPISAYSMFYTSNIVDLYGILKRQGVTLDFSKCTGVNALFYGAKIREFGVLNFTSATALGALFQVSAVEKVEKMIVTAKTTFPDTCFKGATNLTEIRFEGEIASNITFADCTKLSKESIIHIVQHTIDSDITITFSLAAVN